jgi:hypothetical protein
MHPDKLDGQNRSLWAIVFLSVVTGAFLPVAIFELSQISVVEKFFEGYGGWVLLVCPPYFLSCVLDHTVASENPRLIPPLMFANSILYLLVGLLFATVRRRFLRNKVKTQ